MEESKTTPTHAYCSQCLDIKPIIIHDMGGQDVSNIFYHPTDLVCEDCRCILVTTYTDKP